MDESDDALLGTSTLRGILLLGGVGVVAFLAYKFWKRQKSGEVPPRASTIRVPVNLPLPKQKKN